MTALCPVEAGVVLFLADGSAAEPPWLPVPGQPPAPLVAQSKVHWVVLEVSDGEYSAPCVSGGAQFWCFTQTFWSLFMRVREAQPCHKWTVINKSKLSALLALIFRIELVNCLPSVITSEAWVVTVVPRPLSFSASSVTLFVWLGHMATRDRVGGELSVYQMVDVSESLSCTF